MSQNPLKWLFLEDFKKLKKERNWEKKSYYPILFCYWGRLVLDQSSPGHPVSESMGVYPERDTHTDTRRTKEQVDRNPCV